MATTPYTAKVKLSVNKVVADLFAWSMQYAFSGRAPDVGFHGETFSKKTWRYKMAGKPMANGFRIPSCRICSCGFKLVIPQGNPWGLGVLPKTRINAKVPTKKMMY